MAHIHSPFTRQRLSEGEQLADSFYCVIDLRTSLSKHRPIFLYIFYSVPWQCENANFGSVSVYM